MKILHSADWHLDAPIAGHTPEQTAFLHQELRKLLIPFTSHLEIMNRCNTDEERIFYMLYASQQSLKTEELRRCII